MSVFNPTKYMGAKLGKLTILNDSGKRTSNRGVIVKCECECGVTKDVVLSYILAGKVVSCGCYGAERRRNAHMGRTVKTTPSQREEFKRLYAEGLSTKAIADKYGCSHNAVGTALKARGVILRDNSDCQRKYTLDESAFSVQTPESDYWCGFIAADGCVYKHTLSVCLSEVDVGHLEKLRAFLGTDRPLTRYGNGVGLQINSYKIVECLGAMGIHSRKSHTFSPSNQHTGSSDFWRGVIDGDGYLSRGKGKYRLELCGSYSCMEAFLSWCKKHTNTQASVTVMKSIWRVQLSGKVAGEIQDILYANAPVYLDRKHNTYTKA